LLKSKRLLRSERPLSVTGACLQAPAFRSCRSKHRMPGPRIIMKKFFLAVLLISTVLLRAESPNSGLRKEEAPTKLDPIVVKGDSLLSFGFSIRVTRITEPKSIVSLVIGRVQPGSDADIKGLKPESRIVS